MCRQIVADLSIIAAMEFKSTKIRRAPIEIRSVWADNLNAEFDIIRSAVEHFPIVTVDSEFPGLIHLPSVHPRLLSSTDRYALLKSNVDALSIIQIGLTLSNTSGDVFAVWDFNFCDFDIRNGDPHAPDSISLLRSHGFDFDVLRSNGIDSRRFGELLMSSGLVCNSSMKWIVFHGAHDFGYMIKILTGAALPATMPGFLELVGVYFGDNAIDVKHAMRRFNGLFGGLERVAGTLGVKRTAGVSHHAGSDSLLTWMVFKKMKEVFFVEEEKDAGVIHGLEGGTSISQFSC